MKILGISGSIYQTHEPTDGDRHDAAAVLIIDGQVVAAIEEERLNRIKHTDKFPINAIRFVLQQAGIGLSDLDQVCYYVLQQHLFIEEESISFPEKIQSLLYEAFAYRIDEKKIYFVHHHLAHAVSSFYMSGYEQSLVLSIDGMGDGISGMVLNASTGGKKLQVLDRFSVEDSLGIYYLHVIHILGYKQFDEYKVMGLVPYGNPATYRDLFRTFYTLLPEGKYHIDLKKVKKVYLLTPRRKNDEPFTQVHKDIAAALQESLEEIVMHILKYYQDKYNHTHLCLVGGVAHNCTMNGKILYWGLFKDVFVQPASHDAGCALGAALYRYHELNPGSSLAKLEHLYWGKPIGSNDSILDTLERWEDFVSYERSDDITGKTAQLLADGAVVGWVQGKSEFGPRALGNRSILADPRSAENKDIINAMVKKREAYRPFAPSVLEEYAAEYYQLPLENGYGKFSYMIFVVKVKEDKQKILGAVTHVDGTARIQTVSRQTNTQYWNLIEAFRKITGIPILLNTSFNNNAEPIVDSAEDALACFYTTKLNYLVIGDYLVRKKEANLSSYLQLVPSIPVHNVLLHTSKFVSPRQVKKLYEVKNNYDNGYQTTVSAALFQVLGHINGCGTLQDVLDKAGINTREEKESIVREMKELWGKRFIRLNPGVLTAEAFASSIRPG